VGAGAGKPTGAFACKSIEVLQAEAGSHGLRRALGPLHLVLFGIGCILGAGIYVLPGTAAANFAGPAVMFSFVLAGTACALTALCYAELASTMPVSGSSYSYCYASLGEVFAWGLGWILMLEYTLASSTLARGQCEPRFQRGDSKLRVSIHDPCSDQRRYVPLPTPGVRRTTLQKMIVPGVLSARSIRRACRESV
jgi:hypothetical protein